MPHKEKLHDDNSELLKLLVTDAIPTSEQFKELIYQIDTLDILVKIFILEGTPCVFKNSPMKYMVFKEQVADRFNIGSQDVRIVGSAKLGFSPSPSQKFGNSFSETSDVDVVLVSEHLFHQGSREVFKDLMNRGPNKNELSGKSFDDECNVCVRDFSCMKEAIRNYYFQNFNPGLLSEGSELKQEIFSKISSTSGLFLALEPKVFVSKIRCRVFRNWRATEDYYTNSLRSLRQFFEKGNPEDDIDDGAQVDNQVQ